MESLVKKLFVALIILLCTCPAYSYDDESAHPEINLSALRVWRSETLNQKKPVDLSLYLIDSSEYQLFRRLSGTTVCVAGNWHSDMIETVRDKRFYEWISSGGRTADAPHWFQSLRHFYNPLEPENMRYLTDIPTVAQMYARVQSRVPGTENVAIVNPEIDARHWALDGTAKIPDTPDNHYAWKHGIAAMKKAFAEPDYHKKQELFAFSWRVLGETMHLLADMTVPAHVRDDAHPMAEHVTILNLRGDSYELNIYGEHVKRVFNGLSRGSMGGIFIEDHIDHRLVRQIRRANPKDLFHYIALYVNENFFSSDTIAGTIEGREIRPANDRVFPSPRLEDCTWQQHGNTGAYFKKLPQNARIQVDVMMAQESIEKPSFIDYLRRRWHERRTIETGAAGALSQARVLLPIAFLGCARLIDLYMPRVEVKLKNYDYETNTLSGEIIHHPYGAHKEKYAYNLEKNYAARLFDIFVNNKLHSYHDIEFEVNKGRITAHLGRLQLKDNDKMYVVASIGGIPIKSNSLGISIDEEDAKVACPQWDCGFGLDLSTLRKISNRDTFRPKIHYVNDKFQKHGPEITWFNSNRTRRFRVACYYEGKLNGLVKTWYENGNKRDTHTYVDGQRHGPYQRRDQEGRKRSDGAYKNGMPHGNWKVWNESGTLIIDQNYDAKYAISYNRGGRHGSYKTWWDNGNPKVFGSYRQNALHGKYEQWTEEGNYLSKGNFNNGAKSGKWTYWYTNGQIQATGSYAEDRRTGTWQEWDTDGRERRPREY